MIYLIIVYLFLFLFLSWRRLDWAVMLILATLPSYLIRFNILGLPFTLLEAMILISFTVWFVKNYKEVFSNIANKLKAFVNSKLKIQNSKFIRYPFDIEIVLLLIISFIAVGVAGFSNSAFGIWKAYFFEPPLFYILLFNVFKKNTNKTNDKRIERIVWPLAVSALSVSLVAIYQKITGQLIFNPMWAAEGTRRVVSFFGYPNAVGLYLAPIVMLMIGYLFYQITKKIQSQNDKKMFRNLKLGFDLKFGIRNLELESIFITLIIILSILSIYFARSRGAMMGLAAGLIVFGLLVNKKIRWAIILFLIICSLGIGLFAPLRTKVIDAVTLMDLSGQIRKAQWKETWAMLSDGRLITGAGLANYQTAIKPYHAEGIFVVDPHDPDWHRKTVFNKEFRDSVWQPVEIYMYPHNIFLNFWSELGIFGMLLFCWIIGKFFVIGIFNFQFSIFKQIQNSKYLVLGLIGAMVAIVVHGFVDVPYFKNDLSVMFWVIVAMMGMMNLELKNKKEN